MTTLHLSYLVIEFRQTYPKLKIFIIYSPLAIAARFMNFETLSMKYENVFQCIG